MTRYYPDVWKVLRMTNKEDNTVIEKVLAGWHGGFAGGDSWKINSGNVETKEFKDRYEFRGYSGSIYVCHKASERFSALTSGIYSTLVEGASKDNKWTIEVVDMNNEN